MSQGLLSPGSFVVGVVGPLTVGADDDVADRVGELSPQVGVGAGVRWRSPVGPLQADLAYGLKAKSVRLHLRLGFTF